MMPLPPHCLGPNAAFEMPMELHLAFLLLDPFGIISTSPATRFARVLFRGHAATRVCWQKWCWGAETGWLAAEYHQARASSRTKLARRVAS